MKHKPELHDIFRISMTNYWNLSNLHYICDINLISFNHWKYGAEFEF